MNNFRKSRLAVLICLLIAVVALTAVFSLNIFADDVVTGFTGTTLTLNDGTNIRFAGTLAESDRTGATVVYTLSEHTYTVDITPDENGAFAVDIPVGAGEMAQSVTVKIMVNGAEKATAAKSVKEYAAYQLENGDDATKRVVSEMLRYGEEAYKYANGGAASELLTGLTLTDALPFPASPVYTYAKDITGNFTKIKLTLTENLRLSLTTKDGESVKKSVKISQFFDGVTVTAKDGASVTASPSLYAALNKNDSAVGKLVRSLYNYAVAVHMAIGEHTFDNRIAAYSFLKSPATCSSAAVYYTSCLCGEVSEDTFTFGEAVDHVFTDEADLTHKKADATCQSPAIYYKTCAWCDEKGGEGDVFTHGDPLTHTLTQEVVQPRYLASAATCQAAATYYKSCAACGAFDENGETFAYGEKAPHAYTEEVSEDNYLKDEATCTSAAVYYLSCACGEKGGEEDTFQFGQPLPHEYTEQVVHEDHLAHPADCDTPARYYMSCACGANGSETFENGDALGHSYGSGVTTPADCENAEVTRYTCTKCDHYYEDIGEAAKGHNLTGAQLLREEQVGDSCQYTQIYRCMTCGNEATGDTVTKHTHIATVTTPATCKVNGLMTYTCACGDTYTDAIPANASAHQWVGVEGSTTNFACAAEGCDATKTVVDASEDTSADVSKDTLADASLQLKDAEIKLDPDILESEALAGENDLTIGATTTTKDNLPAGVELTEFQKQQIGNSLIYDFTMKNGETAISNFKDANGNEKFVTITIPYTLAEGEDADSIFIWFINDNGQVEAIAATYNVVDGKGYVSFETSHFSYYSVTMLTPDEQCEFYGEHVENTMDIPATCSAGGYTLHICSRCGYTYKSHETAALGHNYSIDADASAEATCQSGGQTVMVCGTCHHSYTIIHTKLTHAYGEGVVTPPTCESRGYTTYTCSSCSYSYRDSYVAALRHNYTPVWTWNNDNTQANVTFTCQNNNEHTSVLEASVRTRNDVATCQKDGFISAVASVYFGGKTYTDSKTEILPKLEHTYDYLLYDKDEHWVACLCGDVKTDDLGNEIREPHTCTETILSSATCQKAGEKRITCDCGYTTLEAIAKIDHTYAGGVCTMCGSEEEEAILCDHALTETVTLDLSPFGCCQSSFTYKTCLCGEVKVADIEDLQNFVCFNKSEPDEDAMTGTGTKEDPMRTVLTCPDCPIVMDIEGVMEQNGCHMFISYLMTIRINGEVIVEGLYAEMDEDNHREQVSVTIDLSTLSNCGGTIRASRCGRCGEYTYLERMEPGCRDVTSTQEVVIIDGVPHMIQTMTCNAAGCGLVFKMDMCEEHQGPCMTIQHSIVSVYDEGVLKYTITARQYQDSHEFEYEATFQNPNDPTCVGGVAWRAVCRICETVRTGNDTSHRTETEEIDFNGQNCCGGILEVERCILCQQITHANMYSLDCRWMSVSSQVSADGSRMEMMQCSRCGLQRGLLKTPNASLSHDCLTVYDVEAAYVMGALTVFSYETTERSYHHDWNYTFHFQNPDMPNCEDGFTYDAVCTLCGETDKSYGTLSHHFQSIDTNEKFTTDGTMCNGVEVHVSKCLACGAIRSQWVNFYCPHTTQTTTYTDDLGEHTVHTRTCPDCHYSVIEDSVLLSVNGCVSYYQVSISITQDGTHQMSYDYVREENNHDMVQGEIIGDCTSGWHRTDTCSRCDYTEEHGDQGHNYERQHIDLSAYTSCGGYLYKNVCRFCGEVSETMSEYSFPCSLGMREGERTYTDSTTGLVHTTWHQTCAVCGMVFVHDRYETPRPGMSSCYVYMHETITLYKDDAMVLTFQRRQDEEHHAYVDEYTLINTELGCEGGWTLRRFCENCPYEDNNMHGTGHRQHISQSISLSDRGGCAGTLNVYACDVCGKFLHTEQHKLQCSMSQEAIDYVDDLQRHVHGYRNTCVRCGFIYEDVYYTEPTDHPCKTEGYHTIRAILNNDELLRYTYVSIHEDHSYVTGNVRYIDENSSSCLQGICITYICTECARSYDSQAAHHELLTIEEIDLAMYGSNCGGTVVQRMCLCGAEKRMELHSNCDLAKEPHDARIEGSIDPNAPSIQLNDQLPYHFSGSSIWLNTSSELHTCAADNCGFSLLYATYWMYDAKTCKAYEYQAYTLNYNEKDGTSSHTLSNQTGNWQYYHEYEIAKIIDENTGKETGLTYTCRHCGSIYQKDVVYGNDGQEISVTHSFDNRIHGDLPYYIQSVMTYENGHEQWATTYIDAKGNHTYTTTHTTEVYEDIPEVFGDEATARQHTITQQLDGVDYYIERHVEVYYKGGNYTLMRYQTDCRTGTWWQDTYEYSFSSGCQYRITYTTSDGFTNANAWQNTCREECISDLSCTPTCSQDGVWVYGCPVCGSEVRRDIQSAYGHKFESVTNEDGSIPYYYCVSCGLKSDTGKNGSMILEDMSDEENYIVGYCGQNADYTYTMVMELSVNGAGGLPIGSPVVVHGGETGERKLVFSKAEIDAVIAKRATTGDSCNLFLYSVGHDSEGTARFTYSITLAEFVVQ